MLFKSLVIAAAMGLSFSAIANDGGIAHIDVKGINPVNKAGDGTQISFYGEDAATFMRLLPSLSSVLYSMVDKKIGDQLKANQRGVVIASNGWTLAIDCSGGDLNQYEDLNTAKFVSKPTECNINLSKGSYLDELGDTWDMKSKDYEKNMCE